MASRFRVLCVHEIDEAVQARFETLLLDDLAAGDVLVRVAYSDIDVGAFDACLNGCVTGRTVVRIGGD